MIQVGVAPGSAAHRTPRLPDVSVLRPDADQAGARHQPACRDVESLLQSQPGGRLVTSLSALAVSGTLPALHSARRAVARLDATDYEVSVCVQEVPPDSLFEVVWTPVTAVVDLMLDWDLHDLEISLEELAEWLDVEVVVAHRALDRLARYTGVTVAEPVGDDDEVRVWLDVDHCPLTSSVLGALPSPA